MRGSKEISTRNEAAFQQLFHGDSANQAVSFATGRNGNDPLAFVSDVLHQDARSEGISYGMMIAVQMNKKIEFDAIWNTPIPSAFNERYYDGLLYLMSLLHCSGEFRIWASGI